MKRRVVFCGVDYFRCGKCELYRPRGDFMKNKSVAWGLDSRCRRCRGRHGGRHQSWGNRTLFARMLEVASARE